VALAEVIHFVGLHSWGKFYDEGELKTPSTLEMAITAAN
jgi:hypothetical protein